MIEEKHFIVFKQKTAYEMRNSDWSSDVCSSDLHWFRDVVRQDNEYLNYLDRKNPSLDDQKKFVNHLFKKVILGKTVINDFYEEEVLRWEIGRASCRERVCQYV